jgi:MFS family permease
MFTASVGMFGIFLFLTYYLQGILGYSALRTGVAFLPMVAMLVLSSAVASTALAPRVSPRIMIPAGLGIAAVGMYLLTGLTDHSSFVTAIMPATMVMGLGMGMIFASAMSLATLGVAAEDAGVASATVNTAQQVGGSIGTALLNTIAATAAATFVASHVASAGAAQVVLRQAQVHSYVVAFWWSAAIFAAGAALAALILRSGVPQAHENDTMALV